MQTVGSGPRIYCQGRFLVPGWWYKTLSVISKHSQNWVWNLEPPENIWSAPVLILGSTQNSQTWKKSLQLKLRTYRWWKHDTTSSSSPQGKVKMHEKCKSMVKIHEKCKSMVKFLKEEGRSLCEEIEINSQSMKDTKASNKLKNDELKNKHANALKSIKET